MRECMPRIPRYLNGLLIDARRHYLGGCGGWDTAELQNMTDQTGERIATAIRGGFCANCNSAMRYPCTGCGKCERCGCDEDCHGEKIPR